MDWVCTIHFMGILESGGFGAWFWRTLHKSYLGLSSHTAFLKGIESGGDICAIWLIRCPSQEQQKEQMKSKSKDR